MSAIATWRARAATVMLLLSGLALITMAFGPGGANAKGGTNKPPSAPAPRPATPQIANPGTVSYQATATAPAAGLHGFDVTGFIQHAEVTPAMCPNVNAAEAGGKVVVNGLTITIPCNIIVQMPANTLTWPDAVDIATHQPLALDGNPVPFPSFELSLTGNIVNGQYIAALAFISQQSLNSGTGVITNIDYSTGRMTVNAATAGVPATAPDVTLEINDPNGRFGRAQSPDDRFSVDDENPTIHTGTGYPMCIPRTNPATQDDPKCPQRNRPSSGANGTGCRNLTTALAGTGLALPAAGDIKATPPNQRCTAFVMKPITAFGPIAARTATDPDPTKQVPFEVGDSITYSGTLFKNPDGSTFISAHTIEGNVGVYTQPLTQPGYVAIGEFGVGSADPNLTAVNGAAQETQDRIFLEAETSDPLTLVDIYLTDVRQANEFDRWITPFEMTGVNSIQGPTVTVAGITQNIGGGLDTASAGAQMQRARLRATKAPLGWLNSPTRTVRVVQRTLCLPNQVHLAPGVTQALYPTAAATGNVQMGGVVPAIDTPTAGVTEAADGSLTPTAAGACTHRMNVANGLNAGQYQAPVFEFIFPENVAVGDPIVPYDFWDLGFLAAGEGGTAADGLSSGPLVPQPW